MKKYGQYFVCFSVLSFLDIVYVSLILASHFVDILNPISLTLVVVDEVLSSQSGVTLLVDTL